MNRTSSSAYYNSVKESRNAWKAGLPKLCMLCGISEKFAPFKWLEIHEIAPRSICRNAWGILPNYLLLCRHCHVLQDGRTQASMTRCLAAKMLFDAAHYDLLAVLKLRNPNALEFITQAEVEQEVVSLRALLKKGV